MKTRELIKYSHRLVKGHRKELLLICMIPIGGELFFRTAEAALYCLMLYFGAVKPAALFTGENAEQLVISGVFAVLRCLVMPPLWCGAAVRLRETADIKNEKTSVSELLLNGKFIRRAVFADIFGKIWAALALVPGVASVAYAFKLLSDGSDSTELFIISNLVAAAAVSLLIWGAVRLSLTAVPFLLHEFPELSAWRVVLKSFRFMRSRRNLPLSLIFTYFLPVAAVVTAPFFIPEAGLALAVGISIFLKEDEEAGYGKTFIYSRSGKSRYASEISSGKLRSFAKSAEKAQKH